MGDERRLVLFSGGGSAGHLAPGFALADELAARGYDVRFATPGEAVEADWFQGRDAPLTLTATRLPRSAGSALTFPFRFWKLARRARALLRRERVGCLVALGGWPCAPAAWAAKGAQVPLAFLVPDAVPGVVVRKLARRAQRIYLAEDAARGALGAHDGVRVTGPLLRAAALEGERDPAAFGLHPDRATLFVTGGSLGAERLYERFLDGLEQAVAADPSLSDRIQVLHAVGKSKGDAAARYERLGLLHHVTPYVQQMGTAYRSADLVLCRAGANTCAELQATATPAVLVPYPHHADRQQFENARPLEATGGAKVIAQETLDPAAVAREILALLVNPEALATMREALIGQAHAGVAETADDLIRFLGWEG